MSRIDGPKKNVVDNWNREYFKFWYMYLCNVYHHTKTTSVIAQSIDIHYEPVIEVEGTWMHMSLNLLYKGFVGMYWKDLLDHPFLSSSSVPIKIRNQNV